MLSITIGNNVMYKKAKEITLKERVINALSKFSGDPSQINTINYQGALTTVTKGMPRTGVASTGNKYANGLKFILDGSKQASFLAVAYNDEAKGKSTVDEILALLKDNHQEGYDAPFVRIGVTAKLQHNNQTTVSMDKDGNPLIDENGKEVTTTEYKNELVITDIWQPLVKNEESWSYPESTS